MIYTRRKVRSQENAAGARLYHWFTSGGAQRLPIRMLC
jgi:hypothetical protein